MPSHLFLWGSLGLLQLLFLPGYLLVRALRLRLSILETILLSFLFSSLTNYLLVFFLTSVGYYHRPLFLIILAVEFSLLCIVWLKCPPVDSWNLSHDHYRPAICTWSTLAPIERGFIGFCLILALFAPFALAATALQDWQSGAFVYWDNVFSWNNWAVTWAKPSYPHNAWHYPQLLPTNASIFYLLMDSHVFQGFNKLLFVCYPLALFVLLIDMGLRLRNIGYWIAVPLCYIAFLYMAPPGPGDGYADVPVSYYALLCIYLLLTAIDSTPSRSIRATLLLAGLAAGGALSTKQTGIFLFIAFPFLTWFIVPTTSDYSAKRKLADIALALLLALAVSLPWYITQEIRIAKGYATSEIASVAAAHNGRSIIQRALFGIDLAVKTWGFYQTLFVGILAILALAFHKTWKWTICFVLIPTALMWAIWTSYDLRNANIIVILASISAGITLAALFRFASSLSRSWPPVCRCYSAGVIAVLVLIALSFCSSTADHLLIARNKAAQRTLAMPAFNAAIYRAYEEGKITGKMLSNYWMIYFLPDLQTKLVSDSFDDENLFLKNMHTHKPGAIAILYPSQAYSAIPPSLIARRIAEGNWSEVEKSGEFLILKIHDKPLPPSPITTAVLSGFAPLAGLAPLEGPYPQWNLPQVHWGLGPTTKLEFFCSQGEPMIFNMVAHQAGIPGIRADILLNDQIVGSLDFDEGVWPKNYKCDLTPKPGRNVLTISYSKWGDVDSRPLALLYSTLRVMPK